MPGNYTSFRIQNTTVTPLLLSVTGPDGEVRTVGKLKPGKESLQVAPAGASWSIQRIDRASRESIGSPPQGSVITILPDEFRLQTPQEPGVLVPNDAPSREYLEAILKLETGSHTARINQVLVTHEGKTLITAGQDKTIRIWDVETKKQTGLLLGQIGGGEEGKIRAIAVSPDGMYVVALIWVYPEKPDQHRQEREVRESDLRVFELATGNLQACYHFSGTLCDLDFSPDGKYLALICNPRGEIRRSWLCLFESKEVLQGFGTLPQAGEQQAKMIYESYIPYLVLPSYVRFMPQAIPEGKKELTQYRLFVATWTYTGMSGEGEYQGKIHRYECSPEGMKETAVWETAPILREGLLEVYGVRPDSLAVSREFVITTADSYVTTSVESKDHIKEFFCHDHEGKLVTRVLSETVPTNPVFSKDGSQLIVGQKYDSSLLQIKVYNTSGGQFELKSTYYGHDAETRAVAMLDNSTAVSAGGDQNGIHFWSPAHFEGKQTATIQSIGRAIRAVGINEQEQIGFGHHAEMLLEDGRIAFQRIFDLRSLTLRPLSLRDYASADFQRSQTSRGEKRLEYGSRMQGLGLFLDPDDMGMIWGDWYYPTTFGFTKTGTVITGAEDGRVRVVARERDGQHTITNRTLVGHTARVLDYADSSKWLVTCGKDQTIRLWFMEDVEQDDFTDLEPALNLFVGMDDEWMIWSKSGYYTASQNGDRYLGYHINRGSEKEALFLSSDRFSTFFLRTDIIKAILLYGSEDRAYAAEPQLFQRVIDIEKMLPPILELDEEGIDKYEKGYPAQGFINFTLTARSYGNPVTRLRVLRNGRLVRVENSVPPSGKICIREIPLLPGENRFKIFAETPDAIKSNPVEQTILGHGRYADEAVLENGVLYILAIGVSKGINLKKPTGSRSEPDTELNFAHKDAMAIYDAFCRDNRAFPEGVEKWLLIDEQATKENILQTIKHISDKIERRVDARITSGDKSKRDVLLVFLSGHGIYRPRTQQLYFWNYDYSHEEPGKTGLSFMELGEKITSLPAELILMTDACYSGMSGADVVKGYAADVDGIDPNELAARIYGINESDMYILNAARRSEFSWESGTEGHAYFAKAILDTLAAATDRAVTMMGLIDQVQWRVPKDKQHPVCRIYGDLLQLEIYKR